MKERPIIFSAPMVRAILDGHKTQTRRVALTKKREPVPEGYHTPRVVRVEGVGKGPYPRASAYMQGPKGSRSEWWIDCPYGLVGDRLWVREAFALQGFAGIGSEGEPFAPPASCPPDSPVSGTILYRADQRSSDFDPTLGMPITVRAGAIAGTAAWRPSIHMPRWASRLTLEITDIRVQRVQDINELDCEAELGVPAYALGNDAYPRFAEVWEQINGKRGHGWDANPWVWALTFRRVA